MIETKFEDVKEGTFVLPDDSKKKIFYILRKRSDSFDFVEMIGLTHVSHVFISSMNKYAYDTKHRLYWDVVSFSKLSAPILRRLISGVLGK